MTELPPEAMNPDVPTGTAPAAAAGERLAPFWCAHGVQFDYMPIKGGYLPVGDVIDAMHPAVPVRLPRALPIACQPATAFDPTDYPHAGPGGVA